MRSEKDIADAVVDMITSLAPHAVDILDADTLAAIVDSTNLCQATSGTLRMMELVINMYSSVDTNQKG